MSQPHASAAPFEPTVANYPKGTWGVGPSWATDPAKASLHRITQAASVEQASAQATLEVVMLLHGIRRILIWTAVIVPSALLILGIIIAVSTSQSSPSGF